MKISYSAYLEFIVRNKTFDNYLCYKYYLIVAQRFMLQPVPEKRSES